ncbi:hypothetical protein JCM3775_007108 [Rhodotorula graminis]
MPPDDAGPPSKRRKTSSPSRPPPHRRRSSPTSHRPSHSPEAARPRRKNPLEGFDDDEELPEEREERERDAALLAARAGGGDDGDEHDDEDEHCAICLSPIENKTVVYPCHHGQFCWNCIRAWTDQSRKCPLCLGPIEHLIHNIRSPKDYQVHHLLPLHTLVSTSASASTSTDPLPPRGNRPPRVNPALPRHALYGRSRYSSTARVGEEDETTWRERQTERELERRRYIYREDLYAKHVASNRYTGFKPFSPQTFASNSELKAKVIKFIRRELQIFPAVDVAFLTTYLVSIASQLDLRSSAAIRLISDFLSDQDAQHLVHEITTFARSPFKSLEGYDRFVQYGRPHRDVPKARELEELVLEPEDLQRDAPRFEEHMRRKRAEDDAAERARPRPPPPMAASLPSRSTAPTTARRGSQGEAFRGGRGDGGYGGARAPRERRLSGREPSPPGHSPPPTSSRRRSSGAYRHERRAPPSPPREPDWRDRDERYTGSYYLSSGSRRDGTKGARGYGPPPPRWARGQERRYRDERERGRSRSRSRSRDRRRSLSPSERGGSRSRSHSRSPVGCRRGRSSSRSRTLQADSRSRSPSRSRPPPSSRGRSRSRTPVRRTASPTPPPALDLGADPHASADDSDAISLVGPSFSAAPSPRPGTPSAAAAGGGPARPMLSIFGAAQRLLGNGRVVTLSEDGRASLHGAPPSDSGSSMTASGKGKGKARADAAEPPSAPLAMRLRPAPLGKGKASTSSSRGQEPYDAMPRARPASPAGKTLLARLGGAPASSSVVAPAPAPAAASSADAGQTLRAKLQARLTAEYRQALASRSAPSAATSSAAASGAKSATDLRGLLQARLTAEKALAYEEMTRSRAQASLAALRERGAGGEGGTGQTTTFSQATRELLLARLEEERLLAEEAEGAAVGLAAGGYELDYGFEYDYGLDAVSFDSGPSLSTSADAALASAPSTDPLPLPASPSPPPTPAPAPAPAPKSETALKAALLEKRKAAVELKLEKRSGELKERLVRQKLLARRKAAAVAVASGEGSPPLRTGERVEESV